MSITAKSEYLGKVGKKGELYTPDELRARFGLYPGDRFFAIIRNDELIIRKKKKTIADLLLESAIAKVTQEEIREQRKELEKYLLER